MKLIKIINDNNCNYDFLKTTFSSLLVASTLTMLIPGFTSLSERERGDFSKYC